MVIIFFAHLTLPLRERLAKNVLKINGKYHEKKFGLEGELKFDPSRTAGRNRNYEEKKVLNSVVQEMMFVRVMQIKICYNSPNQYI